MIKSSSFSQGIIVLWMVSKCYCTTFRGLKGILHPKMKILPSFTHPQVVAILYEFRSSAEHKGRYFEERLEPNSCLAPLRSMVPKYDFGWSIPFKLLAPRIE